jgi:predicted AlkP superfamily phosphohydrolase/phosphomutase
MKKLLAILFDAADPALIDQWINDNSLPNLKKLREAGSHGIVSPDSTWLGSLPWLSLYSGKLPSEIDVPSGLVWYPEKMTAERLHTETLDMIPFWRKFHQDGPRSIVLDMPFSPLPLPFHGLEVTGWMTHDSTMSYLQTFPTALKPWLISKYPDAKRISERTGVVSKREFLEIRDSLTHQARKMEELAVTLLHRETWQFCMLCLNEAHFGGHKLWNLSNLSESISDTERNELADALRQVYIACDTAIGKILELVDDETNAVVFSLHGMTDNFNNNEILPEMLKRILAENLDLHRGAQLLNSLRAAVPIRWRHQLTSRLPMKFRDRLSAFWRVGQYNWSRTRAFPLPADRLGLIRINLKDREALGIVVPADMDKLCEKIAAGLKTFVDADSGEPIVKNVRRTTLQNDKWGYPDLVVEWSDLTPAANCRAVLSPEFGLIARSAPGRPPDGRSGNHRFKGVFFASGPDIKSGTIKEVRIIDLLPTILTLLGQLVPSDLEGVVLPIIKN